METSEHTKYVYNWSQTHSGTTTNTFCSALNEDACISDESFTENN